MARSRKLPSHQNHERWMISYADFVTLLFAFFVVLFASANADRAKVSAVAASVRQALEEGTISHVMQTFSGQNSKLRSRKSDEAAMKLDEESAARIAQAMAELLPSMKLLERELAGEIARGNVEVYMGARGLTISFKQAAFFDSGSDAVKPGAYETIGKVGQALLKIPNLVRLEGHTDNVPISNDRFRSNWSLSAGRAIAVLDVLTGRFGVPRTRLAIGGYADVAPVASNDTEDGRARNRRVDVVILSDYGATREPGKTS